LRALIWIGIVGYPAARVDHRFKDGDTIRVGPIALTAYVTGGHTRGCTSWSFPVRDGDRLLNVVSACSLVVLQGMRYPEQGADFERSFRVLRSLPADIWVTSHARLWGRYRKFAARATAKNPVDPFIDPEGYRALTSTPTRRNSAKGRCTSSNTAPRCGGSCASSRASDEPKQVVQHRVSNDFESTPGRVRVTQRWPVYQGPPGKVRRRNAGLDTPGRAARMGVHRPCLWAIERRRPEEGSREPGMRTLSRPKNVYEVRTGRSPKPIRSTANRFSSGQLEAASH
jgi:hypothetical protein